MRPMQFPRRFPWRFRWSEKTYTEVKWDLFANLRKEGEKKRAS
jgi:hypothetical protein